MIKDPGVSSLVNKQGKTVEYLSRPGETWALGNSGGVITESRMVGWLNLPLLLAFSSLEVVLEELARQGSVPQPKGRPTLHSRMEAAQHALHWVAFDIIDEGRQRRNDLAHDAVLLVDAECLNYINAINTQLVDWKVL